jgi:hypothetical protein
MFQSWWKKGMKYWLQAAKQGDVLPFVCELGPASYAITNPKSNIEISNRWEQALILKEIAEYVWNEVMGSSEDTK